jgi:hypothetical protein
MLEARRGTPLAPPLRTGGASFPAAVAALDIGKASVMACTRVPHEGGRRRSQEVSEYGTTTGALLALAGHLRGKGVTLAVMEATSDYWKPVFYLLEAEGLTCWLLNARHVKNVPGRPRTTSWTRSGWRRSSSGPAENAAAGIHLPA